MNVWLIIAVVIISLGILLLVISAILSIPNINKWSTVMMGSVQRIQQQLEGLQKESNTLKGKVELLVEDLNDKSIKVQSAVNAVTNVTTSITEIQQNVSQMTSSISKKVKNDEEMQLETAQWTNIFLNIMEKVRKR